MNSYFHLVFFLVIVVFGVGLEAFLSKVYFKDSGIKKKHQVVHFKFSRYLFLISFPILATLLMSYLLGASVLKFFLFFAIIGTILEYCIGYSYDVVVGQKLWKYYRYSLNGYTSLLSVPFWGLCGVIIFLLAKVVN